MKVSSPVGEFPFEPRRLKLKDGHLVLEGSMGAWPAKVEMELGDLVRIARLVPWPVLAVGAVAVIGLLGRPRRRASR